MGRGQKAQERVGENFPARNRLFADKDLFLLLYAAFLAVILSIFTAPFGFDGVSGQITYKNNPIGISPPDTYVMWFIYALALILAIGMGIKILKCVLGVEVQKNLKPLLDKLKISGGVGVIFLAAAKMMRQ